jgi:hypothetical protein
MITHEELVELPIGSLIYKVLRGYKTLSRVEKEFDGHKWHRYPEVRFDAIIELEVIGICYSVCEGEVFVGEFEYEEFIDIKFVRIVSSVMGEDEDALLQSYITNLERRIDIEFDDTVYVNYQYALQSHLSEKE